MLSIHWIDGKLNIGQVNIKGKKVELKNKFTFEIPKGDFWNRKKDVEEIKKTLNEFLKKNKIKDNNAVVSFENKDIMMRIVEYPKMSVKELETYILDDLEESQGISLDNYSISLSPILDDKDKVKLIVATLPRVIINSFKDIFENNKISLIRFEPTSLTIFRYLLYTQKENIASVIFIGNDTTDLIFLNNRRLFSFINLSVGINDFTNLDSLDIDPAYISWKEEMITYLNSGLYDIEEKSVVIVGEDDKFLNIGVNLLENLSLTFKASLIQETSLPLLGSILYREKIVPDLNFIRSKIDIDRELITRSLLSLLLSLSLLFPLNFYLDLRIRDLNRRIQSLSQEIAKYNDQIFNLRKQVDDGNLLLQTLEGWLDERSSVALPFLFLSDLKNFVPRSCWLTNFQIGLDRKIIIEGYSLDTEGVADLMLALSQYERVKNIKLESSVLEIVGDKPVQKFRMIGYIK
uniref:Fimbrial assembly protein n=1 Tax=Dictyoglomus thermophilum TaxID=14 RepID=A0A7C3MJ17_DICTH